MIQHFVHSLLPSTPIAAGQSQTIAKKIISNNFVQQFRIPIRFEQLKSLALFSSHKINSFFQRSFELRINFPSKLKLQL